MTRKKKKQLPNERSSKKIQIIAKILSGILCIAGGLYLNWDTAAPADVPAWISLRPLIDISAEDPWANVNVLCSVMEGGSFVLNLSAGALLDEPVRVWISVQDFCYPFQWEIRDEAIDNIILGYPNSDEAASSDYSIGRTFISQKTNRMSGESREYWSGSEYREVFTTVIAPGEENCEIQIKMEPEHTECLIGSDIIIRMPIITSARHMPIYNMDASDMKALLESGDINILPYFSNCMIDGAAVYETTLDIHGSYYSDYISDSNYVLSSIQPNPEMMFPSCAWDESLQWIPYIAFDDLRLEKRSLRRNWYGGILITVGSGLLVLPLSDWIQAVGKDKNP